MPSQGRIFSCIFGESEMFKPVKKTRIHEEIVSKIKEMIKSGRLKSGDRLPTERDLAEAFKVSRPSVREALRALESQGFLKSRQGDGTYVSQKPIEMLIEPLAAVITAEKYDQLELFEMRRLIEPQLAYLAAERATQADIEEMDRLVRVQEARLARGESGNSHDQTLHDLLTAAAGNKILVSIMANLIDSLEESRDKYLQIKGRPERSLQKHKEILEAIRQGDNQRAADVMREHLEEIETMLFQVMEKDRT